MISDCTMYFTQYINCKLVISVSVSNVVMFFVFSFWIVIDNNRNIRYVQSGFLGRMNDASQYTLMPRIGPGLDLPFPEEAYLLGDNGYASRYPIMTKFRRDQIRQVADIDDQTAMHIFNEEHARCRIHVHVEHAISYFKTYRAVKELYRHPRWMMPIVAELCAFLAQRHICLSEEIH